MNLAVFRAAEDGRRTARRLAALGHEAVLAPVITVVPTGAEVAPENPDVVVFTSQHAPASLQAEDVRLLRHLPCFCVGAQTARAAENLGFANVRSTDGDAATLAVAIRQAVTPRSRITFVAGRDRKPAFEQTLRDGGVPVSVVEVYKADPAAPWTDATIAALRSCGGALHYSRRSASLAWDQGRDAALDACLESWAHYCLSDDVSRPLRENGANDIRVAPAPHEEALMALL